MSRFSNPQAVIAAADDTIACLAADDDSKSCLYAHPVMLSTWSGTLRHALEVAGGKGTSTEATKGTCNSSESSSYKLITIPVEASEVAAWEAALNVMHPPLAAAATSQITADNAMSLLQLADKYDMPSVTERVRQLVMVPVGLVGNPRTPLLTTWLRADNAYTWLEVAGRYGLEDVAKVCIDNIVKQRWAPSTKSVFLQPHHTAELVLRTMKGLNMWQRGHQFTTYGSML